MCTSVACWMKLPCRKYTSNIPFCVAYGQAMPLKNKVEGLTIRAVAV